MARIAFAVGAHPDDIEFMMGGTMLLLGRAGWRLHYMSVASGSCGTATLSRKKIVAVRAREARAAARALGAAYHPPLVDDFEVYYEPQLLRRLTAIVRSVRPAILLLPSPLDYMEDHVHTARLMVTAAFTRGMRNFRTTPSRPPRRSAPRTTRRSWTTSRFTTSRNCCAAWRRSSARCGRRSSSCPRSWTTWKTT